MNFGISTVKFDIFMDYWIQIKEIRNLDFVYISYTSAELVVSYTFKNFSLDLISISLSFSSQ